MENVTILLNKKTAASKAYGLSLLNSEKVAQFLNCADDLNSKMNS